MLGIAERIVRSLIAMAQPPNCENARSSEKPEAFLRSFCEQEIYEFDSQMETDIISCRVEHIKPTPQLTRT